MAQPMGDIGALPLPCPRPLHAVVAAFGGVFCCLYFFQIEPVPRPDTSRSCGCECAAGDADDLPGMCHICDTRFRFPGVAFAVSRPWTSLALTLCYRFSYPSRPGCGCLCSCGKDTGMLSAYLDGPWRGGAHASCCAKRVLKTRALLRICGNHQLVCGVVHKADGNPQQESADGMLLLRGMCFSVVARAAAPAMWT